MNNIEIKRKFIYDMLKYYGEYTKTDINKLVTNNNKNTVNKLRIKQQKYGVVKNIYSEERNKKSASKIYNTIKPYIKNINFNSFLDFGGGNCDIAFYIGQFLNIKNVYCVDNDQWGAITWDRRKNVSFTTNINTISDNSIDLILASHSLHHINDIELKNIINNFSRILTDNGILVLREHDSPDKEFDKLLDLQHILFDTVIAQNITYDDFLKTFYSNYKSIKEWNKLLYNFKVKKIIKYPSINRTYICIYTKK